MLAVLPSCRIELIMVVERYLPQGAAEQTSHVYLGCGFIEEYEAGRIEHLLNCRQFLRLRATSGRDCSDARRVFFICQPMSPNISWMAWMVQSRQVWARIFSRVRSGSSLSSTHFAAMGVENDRLATGAVMACREITEMTALLAQDWQQRKAVLLAEEEESLSSGGAGLAF